MISVNGLDHQLSSGKSKDFLKLQSHAKWVNNSIRKRIFEFERMAAVQPTLEIGNWVSIQSRSTSDPFTSERTKLCEIIYENCHSPMFLFWVNERFVIGLNESLAQQQKRVDNFGKGWIYDRVKNAGPSRCLIDRTRKKFMTFLRLKMWSSGLLLSS